MADRDVHLLDVQLQNEATWRLLDAATRQRDAALRYHGASIVLVPALLPFLSAHRLLVVGTVALAFLAFASSWTFLGVLALRAQQFHVGVAERFSRNSLAGEEGTWFASLAEVRRIRPLAEQRDPMGLVVSSARLLVLLDGFMLPAAAVLTAARAAEVNLGWAIAGGAGTGAVSSVLAAVLLRGTVRRSEDELNELIERRLNRRTSPPPVARPPS